MKKITDSIAYVGVDDKDIDLFESQYIVPEGISYNSYVICDEKITVMDTVDGRKTSEWLLNIKSVLDELGVSKPDYLVISHLEPDHSGSISEFMKEYPDTVLIGNAKTFAMLPQFFELDKNVEKITVKDGEELSIGSHTLKFFTAPMVHWPEVMVTYEMSEKILFSADAFGKFGVLDSDYINNQDKEWLCEARRYYFNIVGKYGVQVQSLLKKLSPYAINIICPLHGPVLNENISFYLEKYNIWSSYSPEDKGIFIAYASIHGNTAFASEKLAEILKEKSDLKVSVADLSRADMAECIEDAFRYDRMVLACSTYDAGLFPCMESFLSHLKSKNYQSRTVGIIENGSWAVTAGKHMKLALESMKNINILENTVTIKSSLNADSLESLYKLADEIIESVK